MKKKGIPQRNSRSRPVKKKTGSEPAQSFIAGSIVLATLREPREKFWGALLALDPAGISLHGIELSSFEEATSAFVRGEPLNTSFLFFPMHRVERIALDLAEGSLPSLSQRFQARTGKDPGEALAQSAQDGAARSAGA